MNLREWALPVYTILAQMGTGALLALWILRTLYLRRMTRPEMELIIARPIGAIWITVVGALIGSHFHLSTPLLSFLALTNFGTSWLSREVFFTTLLFLSVTGLTVAVWFYPGHQRIETALGWLGVVSGAASIFCMAAIYLLPSQPAWNTPLTVLSFYSTALLLGMVEIAVLLVMDLKFAEMRGAQGRDVRRALVHRSFAWIAVAIAVLAAFVLYLNYAQITRLETGNELARLSLDLLLGLYFPLFVMRIGLLVVGAALFAAAVLMMRRSRRAVTELMTPAYVCCLFVLVGEILGRFLFYAAHIRAGI